MENKSKLYKINENKKITNNREIFYNQLNKDKNILLEHTNDIRKKIKDIINSKSFIYFKKVKIKLQDGTITRKIIGIKDDNLVTIENEFIPINNIYDISI